MESLLERTMYLLETPQAVIYTVATALLYPILVAEVLALVYMVFEAGRFTVELGSRMRYRRSLPAIESTAMEARKAVESEKHGEALALLGSIRHGLYIRRFFERVSSGVIERSRMLKLLDDVELQATRRLDRTRMLIRIGPMLGLMGTLIPISPALVGLARGDVQTLSDNLVIAFSTTVVGLLIGVLAYVISTVRERLYRQEVSDIEYMLEVTGL